jgi:LPS O-antigen subunit length determinant protein (WzzB/FepE family)
VLIAKRAELQGQRDTLVNRQELADKHPRGLGINDQAAAINRQIGDLRQQDNALVSQPPEARELAALESERNRLNIDLEVTGRELVRRSANGLVQPATTEPSPVRRSAAALKLVEQYLGLKRSYQEATSELQNAEARLQRADGTGLAQLRVLEPATWPVRPVLPNRPLLISIAAAVGLALGAVFAFFAESRRFKSLRDATDVERYTRLPLLAAIPRTATVSERRRARWRAAARLAFATATSVVATLALTKIFIAADIFALIIKK